MGKYFGTDGIRGYANASLDVNRAFLVGQYLGYHFNKIHPNCKILVGKDTRLSSDMFENAIAAGATSTGANVYLLSTCPTPCVAYLVKNEDFVCGIMISASHNPYYDNGIKVFSHDGVKISAQLEDQIEKYIDQVTSIELASGDKIGRVYNYDSGLTTYLDYIGSQFDFKLDKFKIAVDCANGSSVTTAEKLLKKMGAVCTIINDQPDGLNINTNCGSTHPQGLQQLVKSSDYDLGLAFDGDADRLIVVDANGDLVDGDYILYICGKYLSVNNRLNKNTIVTTVMANLGLFKSLDALNIDTDITGVGDKYVYESMVKNDYILGGEQSGHIIFKQHATTGDGLLTALKLLEVMYYENKSIVELSKDLKIFPQLLINTVVKDKEFILNNEEIVSEVKKIEVELGNNGRILVRPSGTEMLIRVMVEAESDELCSKYTKRVVDIIERIN